MKRRFVLLLIVSVTISLMLVGCVNTTEDPESKEVNETEENIINISTDWPYYNTLEELLNSCTYVIIGTVDSILPTIRVHENEELDYAWANYTPSHVLVEKVIVGDIQEGSYIDIMQMGGTYTGVTEKDIEETIIEVVDDVEYLEIGSTYLMFVKGGDPTYEGVEYVYYLAAPMVGYPKIENGLLKTHEGNNLFENDLDVDKAILEIQSSVSDQELDNGEYISEEKALSLALDQLAAEDHEVDLEHFTVKTELVESENSVEYILYFEEIENDEGGYEFGWRQCYWVLFDAATGEWIRTSVAR